MAGGRHTSGGATGRFGWLKRISLSHIQSVVAIATGLITIAGAVYSYRHREQQPMGELMAFVEDATSQTAVPDAAVEVLTLQDALVMRLTPDANGRVRQSLKEGAYRVRVTHPNYPTESIKVQVMPQQTLQVHVALHPAQPAALGRAKDAITGGAKAVGRVIGVNKKG